MSVPTHQIPIHMKVGWTQRDAFRKVLGVVAIREAAVFDVDITFTEDKRWFSSMFHIVVKGEKRSISQFARVFDVLVGTEMA